MRSLPFLFFACALAVGCTSDPDPSMMGPTMGVDSGTTTPPTPGVDSGTTTPPTPGEDAGTDRPPPATDACPGGCPEGQFCNRVTMACEAVAGTPLCNNECRHAGDGDCDDGGAMCDFNLCDYGSDCADCGAREEAGRPPEGANVQCPCGVCAEGQYCDRDTAQCMSCDCSSRQCGSPHSSCDSCGECGDGQTCDDAGQCQSCDCGGRECGPSPVSGCASCGECAEGSFCMREAGTCAPRAGTPLCNNDCQYAGDGDCDDGGPMCDYSLCDFGSDCGDCGMRQEAERPAEGMSMCNSSGGGLK